MDKVPCIFFVWEAGLSQQGRKDNHSFRFMPTLSVKDFCSPQIVFNLLYILFEKTVKYENKKGNCQVCALYQF